ncbi:MAG: sulfatase-like hydrolase/transferase, partial [Myxococcota bacterium]
YGEAPNAPHTPRIDGLAAQGVLFRNAYTYPTCSASRAALLTGRYGRRNGMGGIVDLDSSEHELPLREVTVPEALERSGANWSAAALGKWHLSGFDTPSAFRHPLLQGFDRARGSIGNLPLTSRGERGSYARHERNVDGRPEWSDTYATVETTDDAIAALRELPEPFFLWVAYNDVHEPLHTPPADVSGHKLGPRATEAQQYEAMVAALDREVGRLLDALPAALAARTTVVFVGDNGTEQARILPPFDPRHGKATLYEGGTNVPLIVAGAGVTGRGTSEALVHAVDLLPTVLDLAGVSSDGLALDGTSFAPALDDPGAPTERRFVYTERFAPIGAGPYNTDLVAVRGPRFKLLRNKRGGLELYDLRGRDDDGPEVDRSGLSGAERREVEALEQEMDRIGRTLRYEY